MITVNHQYITDNTGKKLFVVIPIADYEKLMTELDELEDIRLYDEAKATNESSSITAEEVFRMIDTNRNNK
ncbi:MAG: Phd YefM [Mucilaginibacter sp.]|nr:Phd YefM [Mucilaginibacter sp.]